MSAATIEFRAGFLATWLGPLEKALADIAAEHGMSVHRNGLHYELRVIYEPIPHANVTPLDRWRHRPNSSAA